MLPGSADPKKGQWSQQPKDCDYKNKDRDITPNLNDINNEQLIRS